MTLKYETNMLQDNDTFLENKKNQLLAAFYTKDGLTVKSTYNQIIEHTQSLKFIDENTQKSLNQIQTIFKKFKPQIQKNLFSALNAANKSLSHLIADTVKKSIHDIHYIDFSEWENTLDLKPQQKNLIYKTAMTFQLTSGCSHFCRRCNEWALPGVRSHFSYTAVRTMIDRMAQQKNKEISLFGASDPLDWEQEDKTLSDILDSLEKTPIHYSILTKVPKGKQVLLKQLLKRHSNFSVSITGKNKARIEKIQADIHAPLSKQHDTDDLLIPAGLDEDFLTVKPSITDGYGTEITPDGAFIIIPTFTSALHPFGHKKISITRQTKFFPEKKTGRHALLVDYFKPLKGFNLDQQPCHMDHLLDVQIESILLDNGNYELTPPGMRSTKEYLSIFHKKARLQRQKMTVSVVRRLKKEFLKSCNFKTLPDQTKEIYLKKINHHLDLCKRENCLEAKLSTLSFFLKAIHEYVQKNTTKIQIIKFLIKEQTNKNMAKFEKSNSSENIQLHFSNPQIDSFDFFRFLIICLLNQNNTNAVEQFIKTYPAIYDPEKDIFIRRDN